MTKTFIRIGDKIINWSTILHVSPTKDSRFYLVYFSNNETTPAWLSRAEFEELSNKLTVVTKK